MIVYYRDRSIEVTSAAIEVDGKRYPFDELTRVWHKRDQRSWKAVAGRGIWGMTYLVPFVVAIVGIVIAVVLDISFGARVTIVVAAILVGLSAGPLIDPILGRMDDSFDRGIYLYEIWIEHNGVAVRLLETRDASRFGRIYRAVQRAVGG